MSPPCRRRRHSVWCRNMLKTPTIRLRAGGIEASAEAMPVTGHAVASDILDTFRGKDGATAVDRY